MTDERRMMEAMARVMTRKGIPGIVQLSETDSVEISLIPMNDRIAHRTMRNIKTGKKVTVLEWYQPKRKDDYAEYYVCKDKNGFMIIVDGKNPTVIRTNPDTFLKDKGIEREKGIYASLLPVEGWEWL